MTLFKNRNTSVKSQIFLILMTFSVVLILLSQIGFFRIIPLPDIFSVSIGHAVYNTKKSLQELFSKFDENTILVKDNIDLRKKIIRDEAELGKLNDLQKENDSLKSLSKVITLKDALIESTSLSRLTVEKLPSIITIDKGKHDGIDVNKIVINDTGSLIGFVQNIFEYTSNVYTYFNFSDDTKISIKSQTVSTAIIMGVKNGQVIAENIGQGNIKIGDKFYTSSIQNKTPEGIYIGSVSGINLENNKQFFLQTDVLNIDTLYILK